MAKSRSRSHRRSSRKNSRLGSKSRSVSRSRSRTAKKVYVPRGISAGRGKRLVFDGNYLKTSGGLTKSDLVENKYGKIVSKKKLLAGRRLQKENPYKKNKEFMKYAGKI